MDTLIQEAGINPGVMIGLSLLVSVAAATIFKKKNDQPIDDTPTSLSARGSNIPVFFGPGRKGNVHVWAGERAIVKEAVKTNGKGLGGGGGTTTDVFYEAGIHVIGIGPGRALRRILVHGEAIFEGPIFPSTHPSGSVIDLGAEGAFQIFWGFKEDPIDTWAADPSRLGVSSRWPYMFRVNWHRRRLGQTAQWPAADYEAECEPDGTVGGLSPTNAYFEGVDVEQPEKEALTALTVSPDKIFLDGHHDFSFNVGKTIRLQGHPTLGTTDFTIAASETITAGESTDVPSVPPGQAFCGAGNQSLWKHDYPLTEVTVNVPFAPSDNATAIVYCQGANKYVNFNIGSAVPLNEDDSSGANLAHCVSQAIFSPAPHGLGVSKAFFDLDSLQDLASLIWDEDYRGSLSLDQGQSVQSALGAVLLDLGVMLRHSPTTGLLEFKPLRPDPASVVSLPDEAILQKHPEREKIIQPLRPSRILYAFNDRAQAYKQNTVSVSDDSIASLLDFEGAEVVKVSTSTLFASVAQVALRREQEAFGEQSSTTMTVGFGGRRLRPGDVFSTSHYPLNLLVLKTTPDTEAPGLEVEAVADTYLAPATALVLKDPGAGPSGSVGASEVAQSRLWSPPAALTVSSAGAEASLLWIRDNQTTSQAILYLSLDGTSYAPIQAETNVHTGGVLLGSLAASTPGAVETFQISVVGPDITSVPDLSGDPAAYAAGKLMALIDDEILFVEGITVSGGGTLSDVLNAKRGQHGTTAAAHDPGAQVYLFLVGSWAPVVDAALLQSGVPTLAKVQAIGAGPTVSLDELPVQNFTPA